MHHSPNKSFVQKYNTEFFKKIRRFYFSRIKKAKINNQIATNQ